MCECARTYVTPVKKQQANEIINVCACVSTRDPACPGKKIDRKQKKNSKKKNRKKKCVPLAVYDATSRPVGWFRGLMPPLELPLTLTHPFYSVFILLFYIFFYCYCNQTFPAFITITTKRSLLLFMSDFLTFSCALPLPTTPISRHLLLFKVFRYFFTFLSSCFFAVFSLTLHTGIQLYRFKEVSSKIPSLLANVQEGTIKLSTNENCRCCESIEHCFVAFRLPVKGIKNFSNRTKCSKKINSEEWKS